jgi:AmpE protein
MALERVVAKTKALHIATIAQQYFSIIAGIVNKQKTNLSNSNNNSIIVMIAVAAIPALGIWILIEFLPGIFVFLLSLLLLWVCLGCPVTRQTYKRYLQAANREDFEACSLYSEKLGNQDGDLSNVGKQLVLVNYRQYASVVIFFVLFGLPGMVFYSLCREWNLKRNEELNEQKQTHAAPLSSSEDDDSNVILQRDEDTAVEANEEKVMFILDWLPSRITAFGFLLVGHFSQGLPTWLNTLMNPTTSAYDVLTQVAKSSEELAPCDNPQLQGPLLMVRLVKRNTIFLLMVVSVLTLAGLVS